MESSKGSFGNHHRGNENIFLWLDLLIEHIHREIEEILHSFYGGGGLTLSELGLVIEMVEEVLSGGDEAQLINKWTSHVLDCPMP